MDSAVKSRKRAHQTSHGLRSHELPCVGPGPPAKRARAVAPVGHSHAAKRVLRSSQRVLHFPAKAHPPQKDAARPPSTPDAPQPSSMQAGPSKNMAATAGREVQAMYRKLPARYACLCDMFGKLQTVCALQAARGQRCTLQGIQAAMEAHCSRRFTLSRLAQLKFIFPEALQLEWVTGRPANGTPMSSATKQQQLLIQLPQQLLPLSKADKSAQRSAAVPESRIGWQHETFTQLVFAHLLSHYHAHQQQVGGRNVAIDLKAAALAEWDAAFVGSSVPDVPEAELPLRPMNRSKLAGSPATPQSPQARLHNPCSKHSHRIFPLGKPVLSERAKEASRISFGLQGIRPGADHGSSKDADGASEDDASRKMEEQLRKQAEEGSLPVSLSALEAVSEHQQRRKALLDSSAVEKRKRANNLAQLPQLHDSLRALFGLTGPSTRPLPQVVQALAGSCHVAENVRAQLQELAGLAPNFLGIEDAREGPGSIVRIHRRAGAKAVRQALVKAASERHAVFSL